ncbi:MAG: GlcNAc-PI de-N-acetylase [Anaerolineales bacterium]|nr:MAG: GlcNAc-PI de-N-acetylase [Anaerolineales bacterium]
MRTLVAVLAHPDDETFGAGGTLARYSAEGASVHLVCATLGEVGNNFLADLAECEDLACRREQELRCAGSALGLADVHLLRYRDSGMPGSPANDHADALVQAPVEEVAAAIAERLRALRPQVVLTHGPYGEYGHPDHVAVHRATVAACELLSPQDRPAKLYFNTLGRQGLRWLVRLMPLLGFDPEAVGANRDVNLRAALEHQRPVTTRISTSSTQAAKQQAVACHASQQSGPESFWGTIPRWLVRRWEQTEAFHRAVPAFGDRERLERDLFAGLG